MSPEQILDIVSDVLCKPQSVFYVKCNKRDAVDARCIAAVLLYNNTSRTLVEIGQLFGGQDHTTIMNLLNRYQARKDTNDTQFMYKYNKCEQKVNAIAKSNLHVAISNYK